VITTPEVKRTTYRLNSLDNFKPLNNQILIKPIIKNIDRKTKGGLTLVPPPYAEQPNHVDRIGIVVKLPDKLHFNDKMRWTDITMPDRTRMVKDSKGTRYAKRGFTKKIYIDEGGSMDWDTDMQMKEGDIVLFNYIDAINAPLILVGEEKYYIVKYSECYVCKRKVNGKEKITPLNGYLICEKVFKEKQSTLDHLSTKQIDERYLKAIYIGKPVKRYFGRGDFDDEVTKIKKGDKLLKVDPKLAPKTEISYHAEFFNQQKEFVFLQRRYFSAIVN